MSMACIKALPLVGADFATPGSSLLAAHGRIAMAFLLKADVPDAFLALC